MAKKLKVPVLSDHLLFDILKGNSLIRYLGLFGATGSIPPTLSYGMVNKYTTSYVMETDPIITGTLKFAGLCEPSYTGAGVVMTNVDTGASYFMLSKEYAHMMEQTVSNRNRITGSWKVIKSGHAFSLRWITPTDVPE